jgi:hypothetical protein
MPMITVMRTVSARITVTHTRRRAKKPQYRSVPKEDNSSNPQEQRSNWLTTKGLIRSFSIYLMGLRCVDVLANCPQLHQGCPSAIPALPEPDLTEDSRVMAVIAGSLTLRVMQAVRTNGRRPRHDHHTQHRGRPRCPASPLAHRPRAGWLGALSNWSAALVPSPAMLTSRSVNSTRR